MATKEHAGIRKLALELGDMSFVDREAELNRVLGPLLKAAERIDGWDAPHIDLQDLHDALERFNRGE